MRSFAMKKRPYRRRVSEPRKTMPASCSTKTKPYTIEVYDLVFYIDTLEIKSVNLRTAVSTHLKAM